MGRYIALITHQESRTAPKNIKVIQVVKKRSEEAETQPGNMATSTFDLYGMYINQR